MNQDILLSKIVPNSTDTTWSQAYTTLNVYITLSIENERSKTPVTSYGKDLLEKLQREFFALDDKSLENIKKAVGNATKGIEESYTYSVIVGAIVHDILYIVIASQGQVAIKRGNKTGVIAKGIENELHGFSGKIKHDDIILLQTGGFAEKIPLSELSEYLSAEDVSQIAENITPLIHESSKGTESAIILQYKDLASKHRENVGDFEIPEEEAESEENAQTTHEYGNLWTKPQAENRGIEELSEEEAYEAPKGKKGIRLPSFSFPKLNFFNKKTAIIAAIVVLVLILVGGVSYQTTQKNAQKKESEFNAIYTPIKEKYDEGAGLVALNTSLALEDLTASLSMAKEALSKYKEGSSEYEKLKTLISEIENKISSLGGGGSAKNAKEFLKPGDKIKSITAITAKGGTLLVLDSDGKQVVTIDSAGSIKKTYDTDSNDTLISADDKFIYTMGEGATSIDRGNGKVTKLIEDIKGESFDIFGSNIYTLNSNDILKYKAPSYSSSSYFTDKPSFSSKIVDMSISGPVWVLEENGTLSRFTKGKKEDFEVTGLQAPFSAGSKVYADPDNDNIYILDVKNQRVVALNDEGAYQKQFEGSFIKNANSFAIDEKNNIGYVLSQGVVTSFDL